MERLERCASRRVRFAIAYVEFQDRVPVDILRVDYPVLTFDSAGRLDPETLSKYERLGTEAMPSLLDRLQRSKVVDLRPRLARRRMEQEFQWSPSPDLEEEIHRVLLS